MFFFQRLITDNLSGMGYGAIVMFVYNLLVCAALSAFVAWLFVRFGNTLSNRRSFARNFILLSITTMMMIVFVKNSLALSLGLVGALSIIRFRTAIKEPEELSYLFLIIAIGLGCGAGYSTLAILALALVGLLVVLMRFRNPKLDSNLYLTIYSKTLGIEPILNTLNVHCVAVKLKRLDKNQQGTELSFSVVLGSDQTINQLQNDLMALDSTAKISYVDVSRDT